MQTRWVTYSSSLHNIFQVRSLKSTHDNIAPWYSVMFAVFCRWRAPEIFSIYTISPATHVMCCWKQHRPGGWHHVHGEADWFIELSCSSTNWLFLTPQWHEAWLLEIDRWQAGCFSPNILRFPWHVSNKNFGMVWCHPPATTQHFHLKQKNKQKKQEERKETLTEKGGFSLLQMDFFLWEMCPQWNYYLMSSSPPL